MDGANSLLEGRFRPLVVEGNCQAALMFGSVAPDIHRGDVIRLAEVMVRSTEQAASEVSSGLLQFQRVVPLQATEGRPWEQGYLLAEDFIEQFGRSLFDPTGVVDIFRILSDLGVETAEVQLSDETIRGVAIAGPMHRPCVTWNSSCERNAEEKGRRFTMAHELCHLLFDADGGRRLALASGPWAPVDVEQRANAFAAMLLMPTDMVRSAIADLTAPLNNTQAVGELASRFNTGFHATLWHLANLGFIDEYTRQRLAAPT